MQQKSLSRFMRAEFLFSLQLIARSLAEVKEAPAWVPIDIRETFNKEGLARMRTPLAEITPRQGSMNLCQSLLENPGGYLGSAKRDKYSFSEFSESIRYYIGDMGLQCSQYLDYWYERPRFYVPRADEVSVAHYCIEALMFYIPEKTSNAKDIEFGSLLFDVLSSVLEALYDDEAYYIKISDRSIGQNSPRRRESLGFEGLRKYVATIPPLQEALAKEDYPYLSFTSVSARYSLLTVEGRYLTRMVEAKFQDPMVIHLPAFFDQFRDDIGLWRIAVDPKSEIDFDKLDLEATLSRSSVVNQPFFTSSRQRIESFPLHQSEAHEGWLRTLRVVEELDRPNGGSVLRSCLPIENDAFMTHVRKALSAVKKKFSEIVSPSDSFVDLYTAFRNGHVEDPFIYINFFDCFLGAVAEGRFELPPDNSYIVGELAWLARIVSSASAYLEVRQTFLTDV